MVLPSAANPYKCVRKHNMGGASMQSFYPMIDMKRTGKRIHQLMKQNKLTVKQLQEYLGFSTQQAIYNWLNGKCLPSIDNLYTLSFILQTSIDGIVCGNKEAIELQNRFLHRVQKYYELVKKTQAA